MIDDIDRNIAIDAFSDYMLVFHSVQEIAAVNKCNLKEAFFTFETKFGKLSEQIPLSYYKTHSLGDYGAMKPILSQIIKPEEIFSSSSEIAGPPYIFFSYKDVQGAIESYDGFISKYGLPKWLTERKGI